MIVNSGELCAEWGNLVEQVMAGETVVVERYRKPVAAIIPFDDFVALQEELEDLSDVRLAKAVLAEYRRDPSRAHPISALLDEWETQDAASDLEPDIP